MQIELYVINGYPSHGANSTFNTFNNVCLQYIILSFEYFSLRGNNGPSNIEIKTKS